MLHYAYIIPLLPLAGAVILAFFGRRIGNPLAGWLGTLLVAASFVVAVFVFIDLLDRAGGNRSFDQTIFTWIPVGGLQIKAALLVDPLSITMVLFVTAVSALIQLYSIGYMQRDPQFSKFFVYLNLFVFSMLILVMADNFVLTFLGWEGVGACSYWLVAFWFDRDAAASAGKKAFIVNRIGDFGFLIAMFLIFSTVGTLTYSGVFGAVGSIGPTTLTAITLLLFLGAVGKSAQIPLFIWLPDAMEGPTPVSALIHAATMVTAGVYLMARVSPLLSHTTSSLNVVAIVGLLTAFVAATSACAQGDIKRALAYSTISQLGYMFLAVGSGAYVAAIFLMVTHAFFKALLFLGAGSVIHGMHDEQEMSRFGGLRKWMPVTAGTFIVAWLSIAGVPPFSGFWSKGDVLMNAFARSPALYAGGLLTALLTAYYMGRVVFLTFYGPERWRTGGPHETLPHEAPSVMIVPLVVLALLSFGGGIINLPIDNYDFLGRWLSPVFGPALRVLHYSGSTQRLFETADAVVAVVGAVLAGGLWVRRWQRPRLTPVFFQRAWWVDTAYDTLIARPSTALANFSAVVFDNRVIDGAVNGTATLIRDSGERLRRVQTGYVRNYALAIATGAALVLAYVASRVGS
ncbi:MAG TPA: NADH-quinone oxidoreductase subunit L [Acidimicrobiales bacterium]